MTEIKPVAWSWTDKTGCLYMTGDDRKPDVPSDAQPLYGPEAMAEIERLRAVLQEVREDLRRGTEYGLEANRIAMRWYEENERLRKALEPFGLIATEGVIRQHTGHVAVTTCAEYFHAAAIASHASQSSGVVSHEAPDLRDNDLDRPRYSTKRLRYELQRARNHALEDAAAAIETISHEGLHESMWSSKFQAAASAIRAMKEEG